jgi:hypothetical protein
MKNRSAKLVFCLLAAIISMTSLPILAQDAPAPLAEEWLVTVKPDHLADFYAALKEHIDVRVAHGDPWNWEIFSGFTGNTIGQYAIRYCCTNWADLDAYEKWNRDNPSVMEHWMAKVHPLLEKTEHHYNVIDWANSHWKSDEGPYRYIAVDSWTIKGGHEAQLTAARKKMSQIALNQGWSDAGNSWVWFNQIGGEAKLLIAIPHKNLASMAGTGENFGDFLTRHLGSAEAAAELMQEFSSSTWQMETNIWQHHPEFSTGGDN